MCLVSVDDLAFRVIPCFVSSVALENGWPHFNIHDAKDALIHKVVALPYLQLTTQRVMLVPTHDASQPPAASWLAVVI